ncbi:hypothetical protein BH23PSE1_BH23PSE1_19330 [soil metagenome]
MTTYENAAPGGSASGLLHGLHRRLVAILETIAEGSQAMRCSREAERLSRLSDTDLARLGLTRADIVQHAFARYLAS